jgi:hypothetical protein
MGHGQRGRGIESVARQFSQPVVIGESADHVSHAPHRPVPQPGRRDPDRQWQPAAQAYQLPHADQLGGAAFESDDSVHEFDGVVFRQHVEGEHVRRR